MRKLQPSILFFTLLLFIFAITSCEKSSDNFALEYLVEDQKLIEVPFVSSEEAALIVNSYFMKNSGGLPSIIDDITDALLQAVMTGELCGDVISFQVDKSINNDEGEADFTSDFSIETNCVIGVPAQVDISAETSSNLSTTSLSSAYESVFTGDASLAINPLNLLEPDINMEGNFVATGDQEIKYNQVSKSLTSTLNMNLEEVTFVSQDFSIASGGGELLFTAITQNTSFEFVGSIVFNGDNTATLNIDGEISEIDWN